MNWMRGGTVGEEVQMMENARLFLKETVRGGTRVTWMWLQWERNLFGYLLSSLQVWWNSYQGMPYEKKIIIAKKVVKRGLWVVHIMAVYEEWLIILFNKYSLYRGSTWNSIYYKNTMGQKSHVSSAVTTNDGYSEYIHSVQF